MAIRMEYYGLKAPNIAFWIPPPVAKKGASSPAAPAGSIFTPPIKVQTDAAFVKQWFTKISAVPFTPSSCSLLNRSPNLSPPDLIEAFFNTGFGPEDGWDDGLSLTPEERISLKGYLLARLQLVASCLLHSPTSSQPLSFYKGVDPSEKVVISYIAGSIGAYLAAVQWLASPQREVKLFLHASLLKAGSIYVSNAKPMLISKDGTESSEMPDFVVKDSTGKWHLFEAKGGRFGERWKRIVKGLRQLQNIARIGPAGKCNPPESSVCVHTAIDLGKDIRLTIVDPPPSPPFHDEPGQPHPDGNEVPSARICVSVPACELMRAIELIEWFRCLSLLSGSRETQRGGWTTIEVRALGASLAFGIPSGYLPFEEDIRATLKRFSRARSSLQRIVDRGDFAEQSAGEGWRDVLSEIATDLRRGGNEVDEDELQQDAEFARLVNSDPILRVDNWLAAIAGFCRLDPQLELLKQERASAGEIPYTEGRVPGSRDSRGAEADMFVEELNPAGSS